jgi:TolB-like protein/Flp pilus assembly protein TadD
MSDPVTPTLLSSTWAELKRRKVVRAAILYAVGAWAVLQVADVVLEPLGVPRAAMTWLVLAAILGLPLVLVFAWVFDVRDGALVREHLRSPAAARRAFVAIVALATVGGAAWWLGGIARPGVSTVGQSGNRIAVLPFDDLSPAGDQRHFADGIAEELIERLARVDGLKVAARTSSFAAHARDLDARQIGAELGVDYVLEGSVRKGDGRLRIAAQLIDVRDGFQRWSDSYERAATDYFAIQDQITGAIVAELQPRLGLASPIASALAGEVDVRAHELYLRGRVEWRDRTPASLTRAIELFQQAIQIEPHFAAAHSGLADSYLLLSDYGSLSRDEALRMAEAEAVKAVELAPESGESWASLGLLRLNSGQLDGARSNLERAIKLDPRYEQAPVWLARACLAQGRLRDAVAAIERALDNNPDDPALNSIAIETLVLRGRIDDARTRLARAELRQPGAAVLVLMRAYVDNMDGRLDRSLAGVAEKSPHAIAGATNALLFAVDTLSTLGAFEALDRLLRAVPPDSDLSGQLRLARIVRDPRAGPLDPDELSFLDDALSAPASESRRAAILMLGAMRALGAGDMERANRYLAPLADASATGIDATERVLLRAGVLERLGRSAEARAEYERGRELLEQLQVEGHADWRIRYFSACVALGSGDRAQAMLELDAAFRTGLRDSWLLQHDPRLDPVRDVAEFRALHDALLREVETQRAAVADLWAKP